VCWRLARQLAREHGARVTLWIDAPQVLRAIAPDAAPECATPALAVRPWEQARPLDGERRVAVSAFGCDLPATVRARLPALWVNLEYLSAEPWIDGCHGLASRKPDGSAIEHFFYPGFTATSGGLLRERGLIEARDAFRAAGNPERWLAAKGFEVGPGERRISLFCYPDAPVGRLLARLAGEPEPTHLLVPEGVAETALREFLGQPLAPGASERRGSLRIERFALLAQDDYDRLLWSCALNFVRGEDSWIRALWSGSPFVWQPYRQRENAHRAKLDAFLARFGQAGGAPAATGAAAALMHAWSEAADPGPAWAAYCAMLPGIATAHARWTHALAGTTDLATRLVAFCAERTAV
jgi:uncharacterized repeat protein (TIGR03837 family)